MSTRTGGLPLKRIGFRLWPVVLLALLFFGALFWAKGRDPFQRIWFNVKVPGQGKMECVAVLPKASPKSIVQSPKSGGGRWPVVVYLHGSGGSLLGNGNELRQMAEMGLAAVGMEYEQKMEGRRQGTEDTGQRTESSRQKPPAGGGFDAQFTALLEYLQRQKWADTNCVAWVGFSLGAQRSLSFALRHPDLQPKLLVRLAGGWVPELDQFKAQSSGFKVQGSSVGPSTLSPQPSTSVLLIHAEHDEVFPLAEAQSVVACLQTNGVPVELRVLPGESHGLGGNRLLVFRIIGEQCLSRLKGLDALANYRSILSWQAKAKPLWLFWTPAVAWVILWLWLRRRVGQASRLPTGAKADPEQAGAPLRWWEIALRWLAAVLATAALAQTALHLIPPHLGTTERTLSLARKHFVQGKELSDFDFLAANPIWRGKPLKTLLEHVELAHYNRELINWKLDEQLYREFVLSPQIDSAADGELNWRRPLWENFYPRIRKEQDPQAAAEIVVRFLRERVTIAPGNGLPAAVAEIWQRQITNERGFEAVYVAALRSVGVPSRLGAEGRAVFWSGSAWQAAPRPLIECWK